MGSRGDCFDNAARELPRELKKDLSTAALATKADARTAMFEYIETFYNRRRRHSTMGCSRPPSSRTELS